MTEKAYRFVLIENNAAYPITDRTKWYYDRARALPEDATQPFMAVQVYADKDPNDFIRHENMALLFTDQWEFYAVCQDCRSTYGHLQWSGSTRNPSWREDSAKYLKIHSEQKGWCQFCDPVFGNGGWSLR